MYLLINKYWSIVGILITMGMLNINKIVYSEYLGWRLSSLDISDVDCNSCGVNISTIPKVKPWELAILNRLVQYVARRSNHEFATVFKLRLRSN